MGSQVGFKSLLFGVVALLSAPCASVAADAASINSAMNAVRDVIVAEGPSALQATVQDTATGKSWSYQRRREWSDFTNDTTTCTFGYHYRMIEDGKLNVDKPDAGTPFGRVRSISVENLDTVMAAVDAQGGNPTWVTHDTPQIWRVNVVRDDGTANAFYFYSPAHAQHAAALFKHAAEICGAEGVQLF